ncbi:hypothetical protein ALC57_11311 [Trachymyrmex cornetzi]|uniref:Uncharacterized protein n=1 Tax=Trachymyrmex cornetzi TaxID=471704 RepID=A0A195DUB1_9HYME|nr:hypothetical protein ALC57_11311 [Trachymyrmex cornetzi]
MSGRVEPLIVEREGMWFRVDQAILIPSVSEIVIAESRFRDNESSYIPIKPERATRQTHVFPRAYGVGTIIAEFRPSSSFLHLLSYKFSRLQRCGTAGGDCSRGGARGQESLAVRPCLRLFVHVASGIGHCSHARVHTRTECVCVCVCVRTASMPACTSGTKSCANTSLPAGDIIALDPEQVTVRHFVSAILFARYLAGYFDLDALRSLRYLFACMPTYTRPSSITREYFANSDEPAERRGRVEISARHTALSPSSVWELFFTNASRRAKLQAYELLAYKRCENEFEWSLNIVLHYNSLLHDTNHKSLWQQSQPAERKKASSALRFTNFGV